MREARQRGSGQVRLKVLVFLLVVVAGAYIAAKLIPPYWTYLSLLDPVKEATLLATMRQGGEPQARAQIVAAAKAQGLDLGEENIEFTREASRLVVRVSWVAPVEFPRYRYNLHFTIEQTTPLQQ